MQIMRVYLFLDSAKFYVSASSMHVYVLLELSSSLSFQQVAEREHELGTHITISPIGTQHQEQASGEPGPPVHHHGSHGEGDPQSEN